MADARYVPGTLVVSVETDGVVLPFEEGTDWTYFEGRNSVQFLEHVPAPLSVVRLEYRVRASFQQAEDAPAGPEDGS